MTTPTQHPERVTLTDQERAQITRCLDDHGGVCREVMCDESLDEAVRRILAVREQALREEIAGEIEATSTRGEFIARTDVPALLAEVERLARWKAEALPVLVGLQELGRALGLPLGERITGQSAAEAAQALLARAEKAERAFRKLRSESRILPCDGACTDAPEEDCSRHGREPAELWEAIAKKNARAEKAEAERDAAREALARVEALADEWERNHASMLVGGFSGCSIGADSAAKRIRAALAQPATDEATAKQGFVVRADEPRCWRSECRNGCGYPGACSEKPATDEGAGA